MYKKYFCTFGDSRMEKSLKRIKKQAEGMQFFDKILINNENNLDQDFREHFKDKLIKGSRGYGYWVWKPQIILQAFREMNDGDILLYTDVGCHFNKNGIKRLNEYFKMVESTPTGILAFHQDTRPTTDPDLIALYDGLEKVFTKGDLFDYFGVRNNKSIVDTGQIMATAFIIKKSKQSKNFINEWLSVFKNRFNLVDDSKSISPNFIDFIGHRHDQSIFSILCKLKKIPTVSAYETWQTDWKKLDKYPIHAKRDKDISLFWKVYSKIIFKFKKSGEFYLINRNHFYRIQIKDLFHPLKFSKIIVTAIANSPKFFINKYKQTARKNDNINFYNKHSNDIKILLEMIEDDTSKEVVNAQINYAKTFDFSYIKNIFKPIRSIHIENNTIQDIDHYFSRDIIKLSENEGFVNCGSYNGDTIKSFLSQTDGKFNHIFAFEPSKENFKDLTENIKILCLPKDKISCYKKGVFSENKIINFNPAMYLISENGDDIVDVVALDSFLNNDQKDKITFINMDIEGSELEALKGMSSIIKKNKPKLAISVYHKPNDFWEIPFYIKTLNPNYKVYFRQHALSEAETVCYAI